MYGRASCLVFPSRAETWGLPISEFLPTGRPMILADLPYAHSAAAGAPLAAFFPATSPEKLAEKMAEVIEGRLESFGPVTVPQYKAPYAANWDELFDLLLK